MGLAYGYTPEAARLSKEYRERRRPSLRDRPAGAAQEEGLPKERREGGAK